MTNYFEEWANARRFKRHLSFPGIGTNQELIKLNEDEIGFVIESNKGAVLLNLFNEQPSKNNSFLIIRGNNPSQIEVPPGTTIRIKGVETDSECYIMTFGKENGIA